MADKLRLKSKLGRVFRDGGKDKDEQASPVSHDDDIAAFLKPSTDNAAAHAPKIDITVAQRWRGAAEAARLGGKDTASTPVSVNGFRKPKRRIGLHVDFATGAAEIIGEGGDDCEEVVALIGTRKVLGGRSVSARQPTTPKSLRRRPVEDTGEALRSPGDRDGDLARPDIRRAQTVDLGTDGRGRAASSPSPSRVGFAQATAENNLRQPQQASPQASPGPSESSISSRVNLRDPSSLRARSRHLGAGEGMVLRRASTLLMHEDAPETDRREQVAAGMRPAPGLYDTLSREDADSVLHARSQLQSSPQPEPPSTRSPFLDPKYVRRFQPEAKNPGRTPDEDQALDPPPLREKPDPARNAAPPRYQQQPAMDVPRVAVQQQVENERPLDQAPPPPVHLHNIKVPSASSRSRDPSPRADRFEGGHLHSRPTDSREGSELARPSVSHSRTSSGQSDPSNQVSSAERYRGLSPSGYHAHEQHQHAPYNMARKSLTLSPYTQVSGSPVPNPYEFDAEHLDPSSSSLKSPWGDRKLEESTSRPGSAGSRLSYSRDQNCSSAPRGPHGHGPSSPPSQFQQDDPLLPSRPPSGHGGSPHRHDDRSPPRGRTSQPSEPYASHRQGEIASPRPGSSSSAYSQPAPSLQPHFESESQADAAFANFAARVAHMKGVFRLTAEKERTANRCVPLAWLRAALWWYLCGKSGLETLLKNRATKEPLRELLRQPHVDLAKAWWILADQLGPMLAEGSNSAGSASLSQSSSQLLRQSADVLHSHLKSLCLSLERKQLMPPSQSLIQGQDTRIWLEYPTLYADVAAILAGRAAETLLGDIALEATPPLMVLPLGDTSNTFCYGRYLVDVKIATSDGRAEGRSLPCVLSALRCRRDFLANIVLASQSGLVNLKVASRRHDEPGLSWRDFTWKASSHSVSIKLPHGHSILACMNERDFRSLWNVVEYARKVEHNLRARPGETKLLSSSLVELQYADTSNPDAFPHRKIESGIALIFEQSEDAGEGNATRKTHRGFRLVLATEPSSHKGLSGASHELGRHGPILIEFVPDPTAQGTAALVFRIREDHRQCKILLVFRDLASRQAFSDTLNGLDIRPNETIVGKMALVEMNIEPANQLEGFIQAPLVSLQQLKWQRLGVVNSKPEGNRPAPTVNSASLRVVARHATGCVTDRINLAKGDLMLRLPCGEIPAVQLYRGAQHDMTISLDVRRSPPQLSEAMSGLFQTLHTQPTIRTLKFADHNELHAFQRAITGFKVRWDGLVASFGISRRMMYVPVYKKLEASVVRMQILSHGNTVQVIAFMEGWNQADAMCFQVKSTDVFESIKGDDKGKKWAVKMVDAKFALPPDPTHKKEKHREREPSPPTKDDLGDRIKRRFVNLEGLDYMTEHDDITVGFETMEGTSAVFCSLPTHTDAPFNRERSFRLGSAGSRHRWSRSDATSTHLNCCF